jgi:hypothetical protein
MAIQSEAGIVAGTKNRALGLCFHLLRHFQHFGHAVPVAACAGGPERALNGRPGKFGSALAVGKVDISFASDEMHFFWPNLNGQRLFPSFFAGIACKKVDQQLAGLDSAALGEWVPHDNLPQFRQGAQHHARPESKGFFDCILEALGKLDQVFFTAAEDDVAALDVGLRVFQFQRHAKRLERVHLDQIAAADVDAAKHTDDDWHGRLV